MLFIDIWRYTTFSLFFELCCTRCDGNVVCLCRSLNTLNYVALSAVASDGGGRGQMNVRAGMKKEKRDGWDAVSALLVPTFVACIIFNAQIYL